MKIFKVRHLVWFVPLLMLCILEGYLLINVVSHNFHRVISERLYRSAQLPPKVLDEVVSRYHIRSILNLRGQDPHAPWYQEEMNLAHQGIVQRVDIQLDAHGVVALSDLKKVVAYLETLPQPILIHCRKGSDRTGLVSALGLILLADSHSLSAIKSQMSLKYGVASPTSVGHEVLSNYFTWLDRQHLTPGKTSFKQWLNLNPKLISHWGWFIAA